MENKKRILIITVVLVKSNHLALISKLSDSNRDRVGEKRRERVEKEREKN